MTPRKRDEAAVLLAQGLSQAEVARRIGVSAATIRRLQRDEEFQLPTGRATALKVLEELLLSEDEAIRMRAAEATLKYGIERVPEPPPPEAEPPEGFKRAVFVPEKPVEFNPS